jgi:hypothetical protein
MKSESASEATFFCRILAVSAVRSSQRHARMIPRLFYRQRQDHERFVETAHIELCDGTPQEATKTRLRSRKE